MFNFSSGAHLSQANVVLHSVKGAFRILFRHLHGTTAFHRNKLCCTISSFVVPHVCLLHIDLYRISYSVYHIWLKTFIVHLNSHAKHYTALCHKQFLQQKESNASEEIIFYQACYGKDQDP